MRVLNAVPLSEISGIRFGMKRCEVRNILGNAVEFKKSQFSITTTDDFGFCHVFYNINDECEAIEIFEGTEVQIDNIVVFPSEIIALQSVFPDLENDDCCYISKSKSVGIYAPEGKMESILFACNGYYD